MIEAIDPQDDSIVGEFIKEPTINVSGRLIYVYHRNKKDLGNKFSVFQYKCVPLNRRLRSKKGKTNKFSLLTESQINCEAWQKLLHYIFSERYNGVLDQPQGLHLDLQNHSLAVQQLNNPQHI